MGLIKNFLGGRPEKTNTPRRQQEHIFVVDEKKPSPIAIIYQSEFDYISRCVLDYPNIETGGDLFGFWTNEGVPVVLYAIGPGRNANHQNAFFVQDIDYFEKVASTLNSRYQLSHMGEWHSHHQLGLASPSGHDANTIFGGLRNVPLRHMLLCIANYRNGKTTINPYTFHENDMSHYTNAFWQVVPMNSPFRQIIDVELIDILIHPETVQPYHGNSRILRGSAPQQKPKDNISIDTNHWLRLPGKVELLRQMIAFVKSQWQGQEVNPQQDEMGNIQLTIDDGANAIRLPVGFPEASPQMFVYDVERTDDVPWLYRKKLQEDNEEENNQILSAFITWIMKEKVIIDNYNK